MSVLQTPLVDLLAWNVQLIKCKFTAYLLRFVFCKQLQNSIYYLYMTIHEKVYLFYYRLMLVCKLRKEGQKFMQLNFKAIIRHQAGHKWQKKTTLY